MNKSFGRRYLIQKMWTPVNQQLYRQRAITVEPMQGLVKNLFDLEHCWMRGDANNRWLFAAMGVAVQVHSMPLGKQSSLRGIFVN